MNQSVLPGFEFLLMVTKEIMQEYPKAQTVGGLDEMLLKVCHEANNESISDSEFRGMIYDLMLRKVESWRIGCQRSSLPKDIALAVQ